MQDREKEIKHLLYLKKECLKQIKKEVMVLSRELATLNDQKTKRRK